MDQAKELEMFDELMHEYNECYHDDEEFYNPEQYEAYLESCSEEDFIAEYERVFGDN